MGDLPARDEKQMGIFSHFPPARHSGVVAVCSLSQRISQRSSTERLALCKQLFGLMHFAAARLGSGLSGLPPRGEGGGEK